MCIRDRYNQGFRDLFHISTKELDLNGVNYRANVVSKGSYLALQMGYKQSLRWKHSGNYMSPYNTPLVGKRSGNRPDFTAGSAMVGISGIGIPYQTGGTFANVAARGGLFVSDRVLLGAVGFGAYSTPVSYTHLGKAVFGGLGFGIKRRVEAVSRADALGREFLCSHYADKSFVVFKARLHVGDFEVQRRG